jgi:uncharacterized membrane protein
MERPAVAALGAGEGPPCEPIFDAVITPHQSLGGRGFVVTICLVGSVALAFQLCFAAAGFWVGGLFFLGNGIFLIAALIACRLDRRRAERILVSDGAVSIERFDGRHRSTRLGTFPLFGLHVERLVDPGYGCQAIYLRHRGATLEIARDLAPAERASFLGAFLAALGHHGCYPNLRTAPLTRLHPTLEEHLP